MDPMLDPPSLNDALTIVPERQGSSALLRNFYLLAGWYALICVVIGFSASYLIPVVSGNYGGRPLLHLHGALFFLWILFGVCQPYLIRRRQTSRHRKGGVIGFALAFVMVFIGIVVGITSAKIHIAAGDAFSAKAFLLTPLTDMLLFGTFIILSLINLRSPDTHKRLMLLATLSLLPAAYGRIFGMMGVAEITASNFLILLLIQESLLVFGLLHDWITKRKIHRVYIWGGLAVVLVHALREPLGDTEIWQRIATAITQ